MFSACKTFSAFELCAGYGFTPSTWQYMAFARRSLTRYEHVPLHLPPTQVEVTQRTIHAQLTPRRGVRALLLPKCSEKRSARSLKKHGRTNKAQVGLWLYLWYLSCDLRTYSFICLLFYADIF